LNIAVYENTDVDQLLEKSELMLILKQKKGKRLRKFSKPFNQ